MAKHPIFIWSNILGKVLTHRIYECDNKISPKIQCAQTKMSANKNVQIKFKYICQNVLG